MRLLIPVLITLLLVACGPSDTIRHEQQIRLQEQAAQKLLDRGQYTLAADNYLRLAAEGKGKASDYRLQAVEAYLLARQTHTAQSLLEQTLIDPQDKTGLQKKALLHAKIAMIQGRPQAALHHLRAHPKEDLTRTLLVDWYTLYAAILTRQKAWLEGVQTRLILAKHLSDPQARDENHRKTWQAINAMPLATLNKQRLHAPKNHVSWYELGYIYKRLQYKTDQLHEATEAWSRRYPGHPAYQLIIPQLLNTSRRLTTPPKHIALLLPFSGPYREASQAIQDGLIAAWYKQDNKTRPILNIYDTSTLNILDIYQKAARNGAEFIIGPLGKQAIQDLAMQEDATLPILALNRIAEDGRVKDNLFQFGLSPEDEAKQVAERAWLDAHIRGLMVTPNTPWGQRISLTFKRRWEQLGGEVLEHQTFEKNTEDYASSIVRLLNIDESRERIKHLQRTLGEKLVSFVRHRQEADFIFLVATPESARQIVPQLHFFQADKIPVYSTSHIYTGSHDLHNKDLNGVRFVDIPWVLNPQYERSLLHTTLDHTLKIRQSNYRRFYALGIDAYHLVAALPRLENDPQEGMRGKTGYLSLTEHQAIRRVLEWAKIENGKAILEAR